MFCREFINCGEPWGSILRARFRRLATTLLATAGLAVAVAPSAAAADPTSVDLKYTATYFSGTIDWYSENEGVNGVIRALPGSCRRVYASSWDSNGHRL